MSTRANIDQRVQQAMALHQRGDVVAAEAAYRRTLAVAPDHPLAQHFLGVIHYQRKDLASALPLLERSVAAVPSEPEFHNNLGLARAAADREDDAIAAYVEALRLKPNHATASNNLGLAMQSVNDVAGAIAAFRRAIALQPGFAHAHWNLSLALLLDGQFAEGWREYDSRLALPELGKSGPVFRGPVWDGSPPEGRTLLLHAEQGLGDALQFARYVPLLARRGAHCIVHCADALRPLLESLSGVTQVVGSGEPLPHYDAHLPLLSLPRIFATSPDNIPADVPYLAVDGASRDAARRRLGPRAGNLPEGKLPERKLRVGLAWSGNKSHSNDRNRSMQLVKLAALFEIPNVAWFSLQQGDGANELAAMPGSSPVAPLTPGSSLADTAALIAELDLIISVDTSIAHLAGALARPAWIMLPFAPDWRWRLDRSDSPWYPTLRLFRQPALRDWAAVVARIAVELRRLALARQ